jgi:hypothetical protein
VVGCLVVTSLISVSATATGPTGRASATCSDYSNQRDAQLNKDTRDADGDGIYCESLPCPCLNARSPSSRKRKRSTRLKSKRVFVTDYGRDGNLRYKPKRIWYVMGGTIKSITWDAWGGPRAEGSGTIVWKYCDPSCAEGYTEDFQVSVTLTRRKTCRRYRRYLSNERATRLAVFAAPVVCHVFYGVEGKREPRVALGWAE